MSPFSTICSDVAHSVLELDPCPHSTVLAPLPCVRSRKPIAWEARRSLSVHSVLSDMKHCRRLAISVRITPATGAVNSGREFSSAT